MAHPFFFSVGSFLNFSSYWNEGYKNSIIIDFPGFFRWLVKYYDFTRYPAPKKYDLVKLEANWGSKILKEDLLVCNLLFFALQRVFWRFSNHGQSWKLEVIKWETFCFSVPKISTPPPFQWRYSKMPWKPGKSSSIRNFFSTWRIIPFSKWLVTSIYKPFRPFGRGTTLLSGLTNHSV